MRHFVAVLRLYLTMNIIGAALRKLAVKLVYLSLLAFVLWGAIEGLRKADAQREIGQASTLMNHEENTSGTTGVGVDQRR